MSSLAGWGGAVPHGNGALQRMAEVMSGPRPQIAQHITDHFAVTTTQPAVGAVERIVSSDDGQVTLAFAGYLYSEERDVRRLPARHCLALYLDGGLSFPELLSGSFAIAIHDSRHSELHLITDRVMTRPIYYHLGSPLLFASEVKAILEFPGVSRALNGERMLEFLVLHRLFGFETYYDHIKRAPEASVTTWDGTRLRFTRYWKPPFDTEKCWSLQHNAERLHRGLQSATRRACADAERPALMLSGGLDSRAIATACEARPLCVTLHTQPGYEVKVARRVADTLGYEHEFVPVPRHYPLDRVTDGTLISDGMGAFHHAQPLYLSDTLVERGTDVLLNGTYLELLFSDTLLPKRGWQVFGRRWRLPALLPEEQFEVPRHMWRRRGLFSRPKVRQLVHGDRLDHVLEHTQQRVADWVQSFADGAPNLYDLATFAYFSHSSSNLSNLHVLAMERLVPAPLVSFDAELIELFFTIPPQHRLFHRLYTSLFTTVDRRCRWIPYSELEVPLYNSALLEFLAASAARTASRALSAGVRQLSRRRGEALSRRAWPRVATAMRDCPEWHAYLRRRVESSRLVDMGLLRGDVLRGIVEDQIAGRGKLWGLLGNWITLEEWLARYG